MKKILFKKYISDRFKYLLLIGILICVFIKPVYSQDKNIRFKHLSINDGLSHSWVQSILQDKYGFMWIGTDDGLNRYDGNTFRVYKNNYRDQYSISSSNVMVMFEDSRGDLWIGTRQGLNLYDRTNDRFIRYPKLAQEEILSIKEGKDRNLWIGSTRNFIRLDLKNDSVDVFHAGIVSNGIIRTSAGGHRSVLVDKENNVWIASSYGLHMYNKEKNSFKNYVHDENDTKSISSNNVYSILEDRSGRLWIGTTAGLDIFENAHEYPEKGVFFHHRNNSKDRRSISVGTILIMMEDNKSNLWIGIENGGLDVINLETYKIGHNNFGHYKNDPNVGTSLSNNSIYSLFQDIQDNIWIGTYGNGINIINPMSDKFIHVMNEPGVKNSINNNQVHIFYEENKFLWIGTDGGLNRYNKEDGTYKHFIHNPQDKHSIGSDAIWSICKDSEGNLWIGTWGGGLNRFNYKTETFEHFYNDPNDTTSIGSNNMFSIYEDRSGNLWIGTMGGGLNKFDRKKNKFIRYIMTNSGIYSNFIQAITESKDGDLWFANGSAFCHFRKEENKFDIFRHSASDSTSLSSNKVISILVDSKDNIWMGTDDGLNLYNKFTQDFICYRMENGLPDNSINSIIEDDNGNLWIGTNRGLSKFINAVNIPAVPEFKNYTYGDGLQSNVFGRRAYYKGVDGLMYFGGTNGYNVFDPDKITENTYIPPIVISDFQIFNKPEIIGDRGLKEDDGVSNDLVLSYKQSVFSFDYSALNYISPSKNQYAYMMEGFDDHWNYVGTKRSVTYTNLDPGEYVFKVKGSNNDGVWNETGISLPIIITPPFWETLWFRLTMLAAFLGMVFWIYKWRMQLRELATQIKIDSVLTKDRNLLRTIIDNIPDGIYVKDRESRKTLVNPADVHHLGGKSETEVLGKNDFDIYPKELAEGFYADDQIVIQTGQPVIDREEYVVDEQGQKLWLLTTKVPLHDANKQIIGLVGIGRNITERKKLETERERLITELKDALADVKLLSGLVPICANCKKIRDDQGYWTQIESYIQDRSDAKFSHSICPDCAAKIYPNYNIKNKEE